MKIYVLLHDSGLSTYTRNGLIDFVVVTHKQNIRTVNEAMGFLKKLNYSIWITNLKTGKNKI